ncbi:GGDEF domain-containing protein [Luteimonas sp. RD2P54]|uniref:diguanylate cyclase n=1 Tax=Luteimonas endophytica TaxID=3042023 RepID=A0ABT6J7K7_9GAMM|nr:GGDEF domain-containing protein [Luteimonas endophytica]MDH5822163.1 GGDEF domain-containing protein [Luteimonas endophytica]
MLNRFGRWHRDHDTVFLAGFALLVCLLAAAVLAAGGEGRGQIAVSVVPGGAGEVVADGRVLRHAGGRAQRSHARVRFTLGSARPDGAGRMLWLPREPVAAMWAEAGDWRSPVRGFFDGGGDQGVLAAGYRLRLPAHWEGPVELDLHVEGGAAAALRPVVLDEDEVARLEQRAVAIAATVYAALLTLSLLALALYSAARDRAFLLLFGCATLALLALAALNGHLYAMPVLRLFATWQAQGIWALVFLFLASWLKLVQHYVGGHRLGAAASCSVDVAAGALVATAAVCLLDLRLLDPVMQPLAALGSAASGVGSLVLLMGAGRRRVAMAWPLLLVVLATLLLALLRRMTGYDVVPGLAAMRYGFQAGVVATLIVFAVGLVSRISEYRDQRDHDRLARADTERRMQREAARTDLVGALQAKLRTLAPGDIEWTGFRTLFDHLAPLLPVASMVAVAHGFHGRDLMVAHPHAQKDRFVAELQPRLLPLKRQAANGIALQQPFTSPDSVAIEAVIPLQIRTPSWGAVLLRRAGGDGFTSDEMALATEFVRLTQIQIDQAIAAVNLRRSAELDALTGSFNRRSIDQWLARAFSEAERDRQPVSVLFVDLDRFKAVNDRYGHACGDHCLRAAAAALRGALGERDIFGRYGGEEFIAVLPGRGGAAARQVGEDLRAAVERLALEWEGQALRLTVSVGVATRRDGEHSPAATIDRADKALYAAKRGGRNCVHVAPAVFT